jgi:hypothetical protein
MRKASTGAGRELHKPAAQGLAPHDACHSTVTFMQAIDLEQIFPA